MNDQLHVTSDIITVKGPLPGPTVAIIGGMHGNELTGVHALKNILPKLQLKRGTLHAAYANVRAIEQGVRQLDKNLNRCFIAGSSGTGYEETRARQLMAVLDKSDALLDIHGYSDPDGEPFVICEDNAIDIATTLDINIISTNWSKAEPGASDGYMYETGKIGICFESGPLSRSKEYTPKAEKAIYQFLKYFDLVDTPVKYSTTPKRIVEARTSVIRTGEHYYLDPSLRNFQRLTPGQVFGKDEDKQFVAGHDECIIFPSPSARIGAEAFILGKER
ncbi:MAG TPA: succinylglutamate desuccinylase/aspartoacylase family protein [Candidatus Saccharimonadia bacterium]|nr:succinylglutamate desuccinylase/aspartoacylase family protein [Candidatus Saccharimonadia bacterium]